MMSEKVVITKEQAEAIENLEPETPKSSIVKAHLNHKGMWGSDMSPLNALHADKLIQALYIGYEVEPEFKSGQWVALDDYAIRPIIAKILEIDVEGDGRIRLDWSDHCYWDKERIRAATPSEIAEEKERRWWKKHGRDVWELEDGDVIKKKVDGFAFDVAVYGAEYIKNNRERYDIVCFKENRLDVSE